MFPSNITIIAFFVSFLAMVASEGVLCCNRGYLFSLIHVAVGCICLLGVLVSVYFTEQKIVNFIKSFVKNQKQE